MATEFQLRLVTPRRAVIDQPVREVTAPGTVGEFGILPDHANFLSSLEPGRLTFRDAGGAQVRVAGRDGLGSLRHEHRMLDPWARIALLGFRQVRPRLLE